MYQPTRGETDVCATTTNEDGLVVCGEHGALWTGDGCVTEQVLNDVSVRRAWQYGRWGSNRLIPDGTGPDADWLGPVIDVARSAYTGPLRAKEIEEIFREDWDHPKDVDATPEVEEALGTTWVRMVREEVAEAFGAETPEELYGELLDVAALAVSWAEKIKERQA